MRTNKLDQRIPNSAIKERNQAGQTLTYIGGGFAIDQANQILGHENWSYNINDVKLVQEEEKPSKNGGNVNWYVGYTANCTVTVRFHSNPLGYNGGSRDECREIQRSDRGFGQGIDKDKGRSHESAIKEAATDALKRALKSLGLGLGLALYTDDNDNYYDDSNTGIAKTLGDLKLTEAEQAQVKEVDRAVLNKALDNTAKYRWTKEQFLEAVMPAKKVPLK